MITDSNFTKLRRSSVMQLGVRPWHLSSLHGCTKFMLGVFMKALFIGHSHLAALKTVLAKFGNTDENFIQMINNPNYITQLAKALEFGEFTAVVANIMGNNHNVYSLVRHPDAFDFVPPWSNAATGSNRIVDYSAVEEDIRNGMSEQIAYLDRIAAEVSIPLLLILPPPPLQEGVIRKFPGAFQKSVAENGISSSAFRSACWKVQCKILRDWAKDKDTTIIDVPEITIDRDGLLKEEYSAFDPTHGNEKFGAEMLLAIARSIRELKTTSRRRSKLNPYRSLPSTSWWKDGVSKPALADVDPVTSVKFKVNASDKVVTAGSCFAQHLAKALLASGYNYHITEQPDEGMSPDSIKERNYGVFSARYGNIYTARQLVQLIDRAYGQFQPVDDFWIKDGAFYDPYRPQIQPGGFASLEALKADRVKHFAAVRSALEEADVFIFTLGLTETWLNNTDAAIYPIIPGAAAGEFSFAKHSFHNFSVEEIVVDMRRAISKIRVVNPKVKVLLTVSPVALKATALTRHVLVSNAHSKAVLRVAASMLSADTNVDYFPSYEIFTSPHSRGAYYADDFREVNQDGVKHAMKVFFKHYGTGPVMISPSQQPRLRDHLEEMARTADVVCEEEALGTLRA